MIIINIKKQLIIDNNDENSISSVDMDSGEIIFDSDQVTSENSDNENKESSSLHFLKFENFTDDNKNVCFENSAIQALISCGQSLLEKVD